MSIIKSQSLLKSQTIKFVKIKRLIVHVLIPANNASVTPPLGPLLGQFGVNIMDFCKDFNLKSLFIEKDILCNIIIFIEANKNFSFIIKLPPISYLLKLYLHSLYEDKQNLSFVNLLCFIYDYVLLKNVFYNTINKTNYDIKNEIRCILGSFRSFNLFFKF